MSDETKLQEALDLLADGERWRKGAWERSGRMCMVGALRCAHAVHTDAYWRDVYRLARVIEPLSRHLPNAAGEGTVICFNDEDNTTWEDVALTFKKAIHDDDGSAA